MKTKLTVLGFTLVLTDCVTAKPVALPSGQQGYAIHCPGHARDISDCMNKAAEVCGSPYQVVDSDSEVSGGVVNRIGNSAIYSQGTHRTLIVRCGR